MRVVLLNNICRASQQLHLSSASPVPLYEIGHNSAPRHPTATFICCSFRFQVVPRELFCFSATNSAKRVIDRGHFGSHCCSCPSASSCKCSRDAVGQRSKGVIRSSTGLPQASYRRPSHIVTRVYGIITIRGPAATFRPAPGGDEQSRLSPGLIHFADRSLHRRMGAIEPAVDCFIM
jgi:hypothetical protein